MGQNPSTSLDVGCFISGKPNNSLGLPNKGSSAWMLRYVVAGFDAGLVMEFQ